mgnify:CR=1 FL=1
MSIYGTHRALRAPRGGRARANEADTPPEATAQAPCPPVQGSAGGTPYMQGLMCPHPSVWTTVRSMTESVAVGHVHGCTAPVCAADGAAAPMCVRVRERTLPSRRNWQGYTHAVFHAASSQAAGERPCEPVSGRPVDGVVSTVRHHLCVRVRVREAPSRAPLGPHFHPRTCPALPGRVPAAATAGSRP